MAAPNPLRELVERTVAESVDAIVLKAVGTAIPRTGEAGRFKVSLVGSFSRRGVANLITMASNPEFEGALVFVDGDVVRALYARGGRLIGADSNVLFERLGRVLEKGGKIDRDTRRALVACEESEGTAAAAALVPPDVARHGLEKRLREVAETLFLVKRGQFIAVEGSPSLAPVPEVSLSADEIAAEGVSRYEAWRAGGGSSPHADAPAAPVAPKEAPPLPRAAHEPQEVTLEEVDLTPPPARGSMTTTSDLSPIRLEDDPPG